MLQSTTGGQVIFADLDENNVNGQDESASINEMIYLADYNDRDNNNNSP